jgi:murein DD-endopeptidase MepM/ murein hydrolase activator NlpD
MWNRRCTDTVRRINATARRARGSGRVRIVFVRADGSSLLLLRARRRSVHVAVTVALIGAGALGFVVHDWVGLRRSFVDSETFARRLAEEEQQQNGRLRASLAAVRREVETWPRLAAAIGEPFDRSPADLPGLVATTDVDETLRRARHGTATLKETAALMTRLRAAVAPLPSRWPVRTAINSHFGTRRSPYTDQVQFHQGVDIAATHGTPVHAPAPGAVVFAGHDGAYGLTVKVQHAADIHTRYGHLSQVSVRPGDRVERGHVLGRAGNTGRSTGAHLHYEVLVSGRAVNPKPYLWDGGPDMAPKPPGARRAPAEP